MSTARILATLFLVCMALPALGGAAEADDYYKDKTIRILTSESGSGYDTAARLVARHLPDHVPGAPKAIVQSIGGATIKVALYPHDVASSDSTVIGAINNATAFAPLFGVTQANFDPTKFNWLGSPSTEIGLALVWHGPKRLQAIGKAHPFHPGNFRLRRPH